MIDTRINLEVISRFRRLLKNGRLAHAYLFAGPQGIGKSETAVMVAKMINCDRRDSLGDEQKTICDTCPSCLKINSGNHPDIYRVDCGDAEAIKIAQVRELIGRLQMRAFEAKVKICIIKDIENMTPESSNALLKTLEEPTKDTLLILTTSVPEDNLKTVVSRCHVMKFYPLSVPKLSSLLIKEKSLDAQSAQCLAQFSQGCIAKAQDLNEDGFIRQKNEIINQVVFNQNNDVYLKKVLNDKASTQQVLSVLLSLFRDLLILKSGGGQKQIVHLDRYAELLTLEKKYSFAKIDGIIDELVKALGLLGENLNIKIPFIVLREKIWAR